MTAVLDTQKWIWKIPVASPNQPFPRSFAAALLVNKSQMVFGFGLNYQTIYDGLYVFDSIQGKWLGQAIDEEPVHRTEQMCVAFVSMMIVFGVVSGVLLLLGCYTLARLRFSFRFRNVAKRIKVLLWSPRAGEPFWAEITRTLCGLLFFAIFTAVVVIIVLQIRNSPIIDEKYYTHNKDYTIDVPDIRFCFDGWSPGESPIVHCSTDYGTPCSQFMVNMTTNIETGLNYYGDPLTCFLFRAPPSVNFRLGRTSDRHGQGSYLKFHYYGEPPDSNVSRVHVAFYHKLHDPNLPVYHVLDDDPNFQWYGPEENAEFQSTEQENLRTKNAYDLEADKVTISSYELIERQDIKTDNVWNYAGVGTIRQSQYNINCGAMTEPDNARFLSDPQPLGALHVFPKDYQVTVMREQRAFTLVNGMGVVGGIFGLIIGLQACLFGYRPRSPWGVVHRWSIGQLRRSLLDGLKRKFPEAVNVPIVHPVHRRFSIAVARSHKNKKIEDDNDEHLKLPKRSNTEPASWQKSKMEPTIHQKQFFASDEYEDETAAGNDSEEDEASRMAKLEERLHVFELLFQAYYINDEVFQSLAFALKSIIPSAPEP
ncbi:hypothetical protein BDB00DRAFT_830915 [Zychaea mexicana]|uniref:uncharacterized protein n=1 Tax=Zychaea mexicana TaxID=64656 RepID=UPI0022FE47F0|nr:uncharacterized protein BDB00DRAFT_830915 [Zychaea mexicana]KAI9491852.1 hypothetical protein BDB00DRAFT_830915 [Zychaea mexicana]